MMNPVNAISALSFGAMVLLNWAKNRKQAEEVKKAAEAKAAAEFNYDEFEKELSRIVGLTDLKLQLQKWAKGLLVDRKREITGKKLAPRKMPHMAFLGNPGTGKTTIARLLGKLLHSTGVISSDKVIEVQRTDLVAEYVGHTGPKTRKKIKKAMGGVLFVDEAYSIANEDSPQDFGKEALLEIMSVMETKDIVVIFAGYTKEMERVFSLNSGLCRRIAHIFNFDNFTCKELAEMLILKMTEQGEESQLYGFQLDASCTVDTITGVIEKGSTQTMRELMNGGLVDHILAKAKENLDFRLSKELESYEGDQLFTVTLDDLIAGLQVQEKSMHTDKHEEFIQSLFI